MKRKISIFFLAIPAFLVLLHSLTPHHHQPPLGNTLEISANHQCPSGILSDLFNFSPGENHLEDYETSKVSFDLSIDAYFNVLSFGTLEEPKVIKLVISPEPVQYSDPPIWPSLSHRGPPSLMS